jgi:hypothetical protein
MVRQLGKRKNVRVSNLIVPSASDETRRTCLMRALITAFLLAFVVTAVQTQHVTTCAAKPAPAAADPAPSPAALIARAKALELDTPTLL